ncbi:helix-turn-helix domain-containing protein [Shewanella electrodiphila]|uniref:Helix-turn-helix domain-containing protein n=1 Tax=Shewanella electrodiphila TaxID=934143 RepID=A0ABT0KM67_9GAMM|nr:helix-turn-helix transcriptional regulator [Shewanella electrodiphila]MCL1044938.1 helix-turn-helix domain-containing protein [Shewanella electrodiphila]
MSTKPAKEMKVESRSGRKTLSSKRKNIFSSDKDEIMLNVCQSMILGEITTGVGLKRLRVELLSINQEQYAKMVGVTRKILSEIERDKSKVSTTVLNQVLRGVGLSLVVLPRDKFLQSKLINDEDEAI